MFLFYYATRRDFRLFEEDATYSKQLFSYSPDSYTDKQGWQRAEHGEQLSERTLLSAHERRAKIFEAARQSQRAWECLLVSTSDEQKNALLGSARQLVDFLSPVKSLQFCAIS